MMDEEQITAIRERLERIKSAGWIKEAEGARSSPPPSTRRKEPKG